ncbi:MAG: tyrosine-type recombinase/integrase, partial [Firmicutes bacterium]|nr:tyrosine-type recombinase/integrase [Bacillota bacterium]
MNLIEKFRAYLIAEERADATVAKYTADAAAFVSWLGERALDKVAAMEYKAWLLETHAARSVNTAIAALNRFFDFINRADCRLKAERIQAQTFADDERELTEAEYKRLLKAAKGNDRLYHMLITFAGTGIRVSELQYITVEAAKEREAVIKNKGKTRTILIEGALAKKLLKYAKAHDIKSGAIFITRTGKPIDRTSIWREMKSLCKKAGVSDKKVFPHNFRHLFARMFYAVEKNLVKLASVLGHSNINTTKI